MDTIKRQLKVDFCKVVILYYKFFFYFLYLYQGLSCKTVWVADFRYALVLEPTNKRAAMCADRLKKLFQ